MNRSRAAPIEWPTPGQAVDRQGSEERLFAARKDFGDAAGFGELARHARQHAAGADADRHRQIDLALDRAAHVFRRVEGARVQARAGAQVDEEIVDRRDFDQRRIACEQMRRALAQTVGGLTVAAAENGARAKARRFGEQHARPHAERARLVGTGHHQVALAGQAADHQRAALELWMHGLFHRGQEGVDVQMDDAALACPRILRP